jgi:elongation factor 1-alpha
MYIKRSVEEKERGMTINSNSIQFSTESKNFFIFQYTFKRRLIKNILQFRADVLLFVISADEEDDNELYEGLSSENNMLHATMTFKMLRVKKIIVGVNKMDKCNWEEEKFESLKCKIQNTLKLGGFEEDSVPIIPLSVLKDENFTKISQKME